MNGTILLGLLLLYGCVLSRPLAGPGWDSKERRLRGDESRQVILIITQAELNVSERGPFDRRSQELYRKLPDHPGFLAGSIRRQLFGDKVWTYSIWEDQSSLEGFINSQQHRDAVYMTDRAIRRMRSVQRQLPAKDVPHQWRELEAMVESASYKPYTPL
jgi:hypothetical protein